MESQNKVVDEPGNGGELWTVDDLAFYLRRPVSWVYDNYRFMFPYYQIGQAIRFDPDEIRENIRRRYRRDPDDFAT